MPTITELLNLYATLAKFVYGIWTTYVTIMTVIVGWFITLKSDGNRFEYQDKIGVLVIILIVSLMTGYSIRFQQGKIRNVLGLIREVCARKDLDDNASAEIAAFAKPFKDYSVFIFLPLSTIALSGFVFLLE